MAEQPLREVSWRMAGPSAAAWFCLSHARGVAWQACAYVQRACFCVCLPVFLCVHEIRHHRCRQGAVVSFPGAS